MIAILSPAKTLDYTKQTFCKKHTLPEFLDDSQELIDILAKMSPAKVGTLMSISEKLSVLNAQRFKDWSLPFDESNSKQALLAFKGDVYHAFDCENWKAADFTFAQKHIRMLSGLYGLLRPLDLMQPYRLEMGTKLKTGRGNSLYDFWGGKLTDALNASIKESKSKALVDLASKEYSGSVQLHSIDAPIVTPVFKDCKNGKYKIISFFAKKARGMMANYIVRNRIKNPRDLEAFDVAGYYFDPDASDEKTYTFLREEQKK